MLIDDLPPTAALLIIDLQRAIDDPSWARWGERNNRSAERNIAALLARWRATSRPIVHVRHESLEAGSTYRPGQPGIEFKPETAPLPDEEIVTKRTPCAFIRTELESWLRERAIRTLVVVGVVTNNSVEATVRTAGCLGFEVLIVADGTATFARPDVTGTIWSAEQVHALSLANLDGEYGRVVTTAELLAATASPDGGSGSPDPRPRERAL